MLKRGFSKNSILVTGECHARVCAARLKNKLNKACHIMGIVKPGLVINTLPTKAKSNMDKLTATDAIGGTNDVSHNYTHDGLKYSINFVQPNNHTNIIKMYVPHRYNLADWSCVNTEVKTFDRKQRN
jgi:hypothetical protein